MAYIVRKGQKPTAETAIQDIAVNGWAWSSGEFDKLKLPSSFSFTVSDVNFFTNDPFAAILCPDSWDFFEPIEVNVFVAGRDLTSRTVTLTAYPVDSLYGKLNLKLKDYAPQCYYDFRGSAAKSKLIGDTEGWGVLPASSTISFPYFLIFGLQIVPNGGKVVSITPEGGEVKWDSTTNFVYDCTASLPDVTVGEILYISCYSQGLQPVISHIGKPKQYGAKWWCKNLNKTPNATFSFAINGHTDNYYIVVPPVDGLSRLSGEGRYDYYLWFSWDSSLSPDIGFVNYWRGLNVGGATATSWEWYCDVRRSSAADGSWRYWQMGTTGGSDGFTTAVAVADYWELGSSATGGRRYRYVIGIPWSSAHILSRLFLYYNAMSASPMPATAPTCEHVMVNLGPYPAPWTEETLNINEYFSDDPFGIEYLDPLDFPAGNHTVDEISDIVLGDEVHQSAQGVAKYASGQTAAQLGWSKTGRTLGSEDIVTLALNGAAYYDSRLGTIEQSIRNTGTFPTGTVIANRPALANNLRLALKFAMLRAARKIEWSSATKIYNYMPIEGLDGYFCPSSATRDGRAKWHYEGTYYGGLTFRILTTQKLTFLPTLGSADVMYVGRPDESVTGGGYTGMFPNILRSATLTVDSYYGAAVHGKITDGATMTDVGGFLNSYGNLTVSLSGVEQSGWELFEDLAADGSANPDVFAFKPRGLLDAITSDNTTNFRIFNVGEINITKRGFVTHRVSLGGTSSATFKFSLNYERPVLIFFASGPTSGGTPNYIVKLDGNTVTLGSARRAIISMGTALSDKTVQKKISSSYIVVTNNRASNHTLTVSAARGTVALNVMYLTLPTE